MYAIDIINAVDEIRPNSIEIDQKVKWLARCDGMIWDHLIKTHEGGRHVHPFRGEEESDAEYVQLMIPEPHRAIYDYYLMAQIDLTNGDTARYDNDMILYNDALGKFAREWHREHMPRAQPRMRI